MMLSISQDKIPLGGGTLIRTVLQVFIPVTPGDDGLD